jgi:CheY-like chemotaxis protein
LELPEVSPSVSIDPLHLQQMLMNLCINARDAMPDGGRLSLSLRALQCSGLKCVLCHSTISGEWLELSVADTGCGVPEAQFDQIFQPFVTSKGVGEGSGMGLAVLAGLLRTYGAHVLLDSTVGQGSRFRLLLRPHAEANMQAENPAQNDYALANIHGARILIVDDEQPLREFYTETLTREGAQVVARQEASAALEALFAAPRSFDLILSDLGMPGMDGLALAESIRAANLDLPVLICSGSDESITPEALARLDIAGVLIKPVNSGPLLRAIDEALGKASD